jgi:hypothetical protein
MPRRPGLTAGALGPTCALFVHIDTAATPREGARGEGVEKGILQIKIRVCQGMLAGHVPDTPLAINVQKAILQCERAL